MVSDAVTLAAIVAASGFIGPLVMAWQTGIQSRAAKKLDWDRQDAITKRAEDRQDEVARQNASYSAQVLTNQKTQREATLEVKNQVVETAATQSAKLDQIHVLVNSNMTAAMKSELDAKREVLVVMEELIALKRKNGLEPSPETLGQLEATRNKIQELEAQLADRLKSETTLSVLLESNVEHR
jgi:hypothetical protein